MVSLPTWVLVGTIVVLFLGQLAQAHFFVKWIRWLYDQRAADAVLAAKQLFDVAQAQNESRALQNATTERLVETNEKLVEKVDRLKDEVMRRSS
jgi:hypothetical protein